MKAQMSLSYSIRYTHSEALTQVLIVHFFLYVGSWEVFIADCLAMEMARVLNQERISPLYL